MAFELKITVLCAQTSLISELKNYWLFLDVVACIVYFHIEYVTLNSGCDVEVNI
jgi:hypothetical protein